MARIATPQFVFVLLWCLMNGCWFELKVCHIFSERRCLAQPWSEMPCCRVCHNWERRCVAAMPVKVSCSAKLSANGPPLKLVR